MQKSIYSKVFPLVHINIPTSIFGGLYLPDISLSYRHFIFLKTEYN